MSSHFAEMRPAVLDPLFASVSSLPGVGSKVAEMLAKLLGRESADDCRVIDLLFHAPHSIIDRRNRPGIALAPPGVIVTIEGRVDRHQPPPRGKSNLPYRVFLQDDTGELALTFFHVKGNWLEKALPEDETVLVSGKVEWFNGNGGLAWSAGRSLESSGILYSWASAHEYVTPFVSDPAMRSPVVATLDLDDRFDANVVAKVLRANGIVDTESYRKLGRNQLRIAMFPAIDPEDIQALTACIDHVVAHL